MKRTPLRRKPKRDRRSPEERAYWEWLKTQPTVDHGNRCEEIHHVRSLKYGAGGSLKAPDWFAIPVTANGHRVIHGKNGRLFNELHGEFEDLITEHWHRYGIDKIPDDEFAKIYEGVERGDA